MIRKYFGTNEEIISAIHANCTRNSAGCILWSGDTGGAYGRVKFRNRKWFAHRLVWELSHGPIEGKLQVCHRCDTPLCCNPDHLFLGTAAENIRDSMNKKRRAIGERHGNAKLVAEEVVQIKQLIAMKTLLIKEISFLLGISQSQLRRIQHGEHWKETV